MLLHSGDKMASNQRATQEKRRRERSKQESHEGKTQKRQQRKEEKKERALNRIDGVDPDLAGIYPGPQPIQDEE